MNAATVLILACLVGGAMWSWQRGSRAMALVFVLVAALPALTLARALPWPALVIIGVLLAVAGWNRWARTSATVTRWGARSRRKAGVASGVDIARVASGLAVKRRAGVVRPSLADLSRWRWRLPVVEVGVRLCRVGLLSVWSSIDEKDRGGTQRRRGRRRLRPHPAVRDLPQPRTGRPRPAGPRANLVAHLPGSSSRAPTPGPPRQRDELVGSLQDKAGAAPTTCGAPRPGCCASTKPPGSSARRT